jgi:hypothetical protein
VGGVAVDIAKARVEQDRQEKAADEAAKKVELEALKAAAQEKKDDKVFKEPPAKVHYSLHVIL